MTYVTTEREIPPILIISGQDRVVPFVRRQFFEKTRDCGKKAISTSWKARTTEAGVFKQGGIHLVDALSEYEDREKIHESKINSDRVHPERRMLWR
jgi:hypothetical protein